MMHYYQHHIGDFIKDTTNLDDHQLATYLRMLWTYYTEEKPFDDDIESIAFAMRSDEKTVRLLLRHFFEKPVDKWHHNRCDREIAKYHAKSESASKSANARWNNAKAMRTHTERNPNEPVLDANQEPITNNQKPKKEKATVVATPVGVSESVWLDFVALRKSKKAPLTNTAIQGLMREADKAKMTLEQVMSTCCERGWVGFKSDWMIGQAIRVNPSDIVHQTTPTPANHDAALRKIEEDRKKAVPIPASEKAKWAEMLKGKV